MYNDFSKIETAVIKTMIRAYSSYYGRVLTENENAQSTNTIRQLEEIIESRRIISPVSSTSIEQAS